MTAFQVSSILRRAAGELGFPLSHLYRVVKSAPHRYRRFEIPKRSGGVREIYQPDRHVKVIQRWLASNLFGHFPVHKSATAYLIGSSILRNAAPHCNSRFLIKLDFVDFFPSLTEDDIALLLRSREGLSEVDVEFVIRATCLHSKGRRKRSLTIGAASSPAISNVLCYELDLQLARLAADNAAAYTRYADDLTFSSQEPDALNSIYRGVAQILRELQSPRLSINHAKSCRVSMKHRRQITGLVLDNDGGVGIGRDRRRLISAMLHHFSVGKLDLEKHSVLHVAGWLSYARLVEPSFYERMRAKYGDAVLDAIRRSKSS